MQTLQIKEEQAWSPDQEKSYLQTMALLGAEVGHREIFYKTLTFVEKTSDEVSLSEAIGALPEMKINLRTPCFYLTALYESGALTRKAVSYSSFENQAPLQEAVQDESEPTAYTWHLTSVGARITDEFSPLHRIEALFEKETPCKPIYLAILDYCSTPRKRTDIETMLKKENISIMSGAATSYFLDRLEQCGGLVWDGLWKTTKGGTVCLC